MGLPHSSQSMSVVMGPTRAAVAAAAGLAPMILAIRSWLFAASSFRSGMSASTCLRSAPSSFFIILVERHFGNVEQPRNGPRLLSRSSISLPHFSHLTVVLIGGAFGGSGLPSLSRLMMVAQLGSPFSFLTEYPEQPRNSPKRPRRLIISRPQLGHLCSDTWRSVGLPCSSTGCVWLHSRFSHARKKPFLLMRYSIGLPHFSHLYGDLAPPACSILPSAPSTTSWNGP